MFKKVISILLGIIIVLSCVPMAYAASSATLYKVYGDSMLFQQNKDAILAGTATRGAEITAELYDSANNLVKKATSTASGGTFEVSFLAPKGGYEEYTIILYVDGNRFDSLENVVFGELWLASGQSNMAYKLRQESTGSVMYERSQKLSKWLRVLLVPQLPEYNGSTAATPLNPQNDVPGSEWVDGESIKIYETSAVAYYFAASLQEKLDMPVGVLSNALAGSRISAWLSRDAIESDAEIKTLYTNRGVYVPESSWNEAFDRYYTMSAIYNLKIAPMKNFRPSGMIWYQGESDVMFGYTPSQYSKQLDLLQRSYSKLFGYEDELMPLINTQLAPFNYSSPGHAPLLNWNIASVDFQAKQPESRAVVSNYDQPLTFLASLGMIHPDTKADIGIRMAGCAENLVYGGNGPKSLANVKSYKIEGSSIYINFDKNVGDGLKANGYDIQGFTICSGNGVYVPAQAQIVDKDTVRVYADGVTSPVSATYAYCLNNYRANLYATYNGKRTMPVSPFVLRVITGAHYWIDKDWTDCDSAASFHNYDEYAQYYYAWDGDDIDVYYTSDGAYSGESGLHLATARKTFSVSPVLTYKNDGKEVPFEEIDTDYSDYSTMTIYVRNNVNTAVTIDSVDFYTKGTLSSVSYSAKNTFTNSASITIPGGYGDYWFKITYDLNTLYRSGNKNSVYTNSVLEDVTDIKFNFSSSDGAYINVDKITFTPEGGDNSSTSLVTKDNFPVDDGKLDIDEIIQAANGKSTVIDNEKKLIYGLEEGLDTNSFMNYVKVHEDAKISFSTDVIGTGTVITLTNTSTNAVVVEYTVVIFGDYNGDGVVDIEDTSCFAAISNFEIFDYYDYEYLFMAADINGDGSVDVMDTADMKAVANYEAYINQTVTEGTRVFNY